MSLPSVRERLRFGARGMPEVTIEGCIGEVSGSPTRTESAWVRAIGSSG